MRARPVAALVGWVLVAVGLALFICAGVAVAMGDPQSSVEALAWGGEASLAAGALLAFAMRRPAELTRREGIAVVVFGWAAAALFGAIPFRLSGAVPTWTGAVFEAMSGLTTTGASVIPRPDLMPRGLLLWRAMTHFFGGMGVLVLVVAILPMVGTGGMQIFRAEMPGPVKDRLTPRIAGTAKRLWLIYVALVAAETALLCAAGLSWFEAVCHAFATIATGGFSTREASVGGLGRPVVEWIIVVFMALSGVNFALHYRAAQGRLDAFRRDSEFKLYALMLAGATAVVAAILFTSGVSASAGGALRNAAFTVTSIMTTTGFTTEDYDQWPAMARTILWLLMFVGGCAGSTGGSVKVVRVLIALRTMGREIFRWFHPDAVVSVKVDREAVEPDLLTNVVVFVVLYVALFAAGAAVMTLHFRNDWVSAASSAAACLGNIGPGFGAVGPAANYAALPGWALGFLSFLMLLGRLELFTVLVLFSPAFWRR